VLKSRMIKRTAAPRFHAYFERLENRSILTMARTEWDALQVVGPSPVRLEVSALPLANVASKASVVACVAERYSTATAQVRLYRWDDADQPTPINEDRYTVWENLPSHVSYNQMVTAASTEDNENLRGYLRDTVFLVKENPGKDHWLGQLPAEVGALVQRSSSSSSR
jgi:hypothetical protein